MSDHAPHDGDTADAAAEAPERPSAFRRAMSAIGLGRRRPRDPEPLALSYAGEASLGGEASPHAASALLGGVREHFDLGGDGDAQRRAPVAEDSLDAQLRRVREVLDEHDPVAPRATRPAEPVRERVQLTVRLETAIDADVLAGNPGRPSRIAEATLSQLPEGARIVGLVVETYVS